MKVAPQNLEEFKYDTISSWEEKRKSNVVLACPSINWVTNIISLKKKKKKKPKII